jgi:hypothetical protein
MSRMRRYQFTAAWFAMYEGRDELIQGSGSGQFGVPEMNTG